jgi:hypothetical protein
LIGFNSEMIVRQLIFNQVTCKLALRE